MANFNYYNHNKNGVGDWKNPKDENFHGGSKPRSHISRKPSSVTDRQLSAYELEERFCASVGGVSWQEVVQNQKYMYQHEKILEWKDSAVEEAFWDAKKRFLAKVGGKPCDVKLPDPDIFIDKIDWNSTIDPMLLTDLEMRVPDSSCESDSQEGGVIVGIPAIIAHSGLTPTGWGDAEEAKPQQEPPSGLTPTGWGDAEDLKPRQEIYEGRDDVGNEQWVDNGVKKEETGYTNGWGDDYVYVTKETAFDRENRVNGSTWNDYRKQQHYVHGKQSEYGRHYKVDQGYNRQLDRAGWSTSRYKISRYQHNNYDQPFDRYGGAKGSDRAAVTWKPVTRRW